MPKADPKLIDAAIRRARWAMFVRGARAFAIPIVITLGMIGLFIFATTSPSRHVAWAHGEIVSVNQARAATVRLDDGREIPVAIPVNIAVRAHERMVVEVLRHERPPRVTTYRFDHAEGAE